jgi:hypothetical protein
MSETDAAGAEAMSELREAWDDLIGELQRARDAIDQPELMPAPPSSRGLAEGYRYMMGYVHSAIERAFFDDPVRPHFRHAIQLVNKATIDNADAIYFFAPIDGRERYVIRGEVASHAHWRGGQPAAEGPLAPQYLIFEVTDGCIAGDSGSLLELRPGVKAFMGNLDSGTIEMEPDGHFEILLAPERPAGHTGNFISTYRLTNVPNPDDPEAPLDRYASYVSGRQLFYDWAREVPVTLSMVQLGAEGTHPAPYSPAAAAAELRRCGALVRGQMQFWNQFYTILLETYGKRKGGLGPDGERFMPRNSFNAPNAASGATGGGQSSNIYAGGVFELGPDEALLIENSIPLEPQYIGFHLSNLWGESLDFANHQSSLNGQQVERDADGVIRYVVAHRDPGVPNWLDTTGHAEGYLTPRWTYSETPPESQWPSISAKKIPFDEVREHLPADTRTVSAEERTETVRVRQEHVKRRYRF